MNREQLNRAFGETPPTFSARMNETLLSLKEEQPVKRIAWRTILIAALVIMLLATTAFAVINSGLEWYYNNRFTAYQEHEPEKYHHIMQNLQTLSVQETSADGRIQLSIQEAAWVKEDCSLTLSLLAMPLDDQTYALYPFDNLDVDGAYVGTAAASMDDEEARSEHWLWTTKGFGPVAQMIAPDKKLLLVRVSDVYTGTPDNHENLGGISAMDCYTDEDGCVRIVLECMQVNPDIVKAGAIAITIPYTVMEYTDNDAVLYAGGQTDWLSFQFEVDTAQ